MVANASEAVWLPLVEQARLLEPDPSLAGVDDDALEGQVRDVAAQVAQLTCRWLELVTELVVRGVWADQGARTPGQWLSWACGVAPGTAREYVRVGVALRRLPEVRERFAAGTLSYSKVRAVTRVATPASQGQLLQLADSAPAADLERIVAGTRAQLRRSAATEDPDGSVGQVLDGPVLWRRLQDDGAVEFRLRLPAEAAEAFEQRLDRLVELADREDAGQPRLDDDEDADQGPGSSGSGRVPRSRREADVVCEALATAVAAGPVDRSGEDRHLVVLHARLEDLADVAVDTPDGSEAAPDVSAETPQPPDPAEDMPADGVDGDPGEVPDRPPRRRKRRVVVGGRRRAMAVPASVLRWLSCDVQVRLVDGRHPADEGRSSRTVPEPLRRSLLLRDRGCRFPGCGATRHLHAHHVIHWVDGGPTDLSNLLLLCSFHHNFIHRAGWQLDPVDPSAGHYRFRPPSGTPTDPVGTLPGVSAETPFDLPDPWPQALQPPWWDGDPYDLSEAINAMAERILDPAFDPIPPRIHPAHDPDHADPVPTG